MSASTLPQDSSFSLDTKELIAKLETGQFSLLQTFGAGSLLTEMKTVGRLCRIAIDVIFVLHRVIFPIYTLTRIVCRRQSSSSTVMRRKLASWLVRRFFPDRYIGEIPQPTEGVMVVGFNHPTLHEILSLIAWALKNFPERENCFPVNLPWYECLARRANQLSTLGIHITPIITESTYEKIKNICKDQASMDIVSTIRQNFFRHYGSLAGDFARDNNNVFAAPSATRQSTIFPSREAYENCPIKTPIPSTMTVLALSIKRKNKSKTGIFLPVTIIPSPRHNLGLNLFRVYEIRTGTPIPMSTVNVLAKNKTLEDFFLHKLTEQAPKELWYPAAK